MPLRRSSAAVLVVTVALFSIVLLPLVAAEKTEWPKTVVETTNFERTSSVAETIAFLEALQKCGAPLRLETIGHSTEQRPIVMAICADPPVQSRAEAHASGRPVVYVQANIHAGEVEGKDAVQVLLREIAQQPEHPLRQHLVLLVVPVYNTDGNETWGPCHDHRPNQDGPAIVGIRPNGMGLDLNRDCIKAESPEMRAALAGIYRRWNPDAVLDLHTTNGTRHGFDLTYAPPLDPNTPEPVLAYSRDRLLPTVRAKLAEQGFATFDYGNIDSMKEPKRWRTFSAAPRYVSNYAGARGRIGVLSEATSFLPFRRRFDVTLAFTREVLLQLAAERSEVIALTTSIDRQVTAWGLEPSSAPPLGVAFELASRGTEEVPLEPIAQRPESHSVAPVALENFAVEIYDRFRATETAPLPYAYAIPAAFPEAIQTLVAHGIIVERLTAPWKGNAARLRISELVRAERPYQGHALVTVRGDVETDECELDRGSFIVRTAQPLGILAFHMLEPTARDGLTAWNFFDRGLRAKRLHPVTKIVVPVHAASQVVTP